MSQLRISIDFSHRHASDHQMLLCKTDPCHVHKQAGASHCANTHDRDHNQPCGVSVLAQTGIVTAELPVKVQTHGQVEATHAYDKTHEPRHVGNLIETTQQLPHRLHLSACHLTVLHHNVRLVSEVLEFVRAINNKYLP